MYSIKRLTLPIMQREPFGSSVAGAAGRDENFSSTANCSELYEAIVFQENSGRSKVSAIPISSAASIKGDTNIKLERRQTQMVLLGAELIEESACGSRSR
jgi:hypothetical protein